MRNTLLLLLVPLCSFAQSSVPPAPDSTPVIRVLSQFVVIDALVENKKTGALIGDLLPEDFTISEDGVPQTATYFSRDELPLSVVFLFDLTDTVRSVLKPLAEAAREILSHLKPRDDAAIMVFSSHTNLLQDFTTDRSLVASAVAKASSMRSNEGTFIHEDMYEAVDQALKSTVPESRRVLVWLTDGTANMENSFTRKAIGNGAPARLHTKEEATGKLLRSGVVVSALIDRSAATNALVIASDANPFAFIFGARVGDVRKYADATGGPVLNTSKTEVATRLALLIDQIRNRYTLGYKPVGSKPEGTFCAVRLQLRREAYAKHPEFRKSDIVVRSKRGYYR